MPVSAGRSVGNAVSFWFSQFTSSRLVTWEISQGGWERKGLGSKNSKTKRAIGTCGQREFKGLPPWSLANFSRLQPFTAVALKITSRNSFAPSQTFPFSSTLSSVLSSYSLLRSSSSKPSPSLPSGRKTSEGTELLPGCDLVLLSSSSKESQAKSRKEIEIETGRK